MGRLQLSPLLLIVAGRVRDLLQPAVRFGRDYGTVKIFPEYGSLALLPEGYPLTSTYLDGSEGLKTNPGLFGTGLAVGNSEVAVVEGPSLGGSGERGVEEVATL